MKNILLFGAGKSATVLIDYLLTNAFEEGWNVTVVDADFYLAQDKLNQSPFGKAASFDINNKTELDKYIANADIVLSLLPPALHIVIARACIINRKSLLTASYVDAEMRSLQEDIEKADLLFLCEMGLDPGLDHMSAKKIIDDILAQGGTIHSFISHCGGLVAPESDDNPWHYKVTWNPRNIVMAGKAGAIFRQSGEEKILNHQELFAEKRYVEVEDDEILCWYPNRYSLGYMSMYNVPHCPVFIRTTLRHPDFIYGWKNIIDLKLTDEDVVYETDGKTLMEFFKEHMDKNNFSDWLQQKMHEQLDYSKKLLQDLMHLIKTEEKAEESGVEPVEEFMVVSEEGGLQNIEMEELKTNAAANIAHRMHEANLTLKQLFYLGMDDEETLINKGRCSAADVLQFAIEKKLSLRPSDKDRVVMLHEIKYELDDASLKIKSLLKVTGDDEKHTAMAKTVGLPLGIAAKFILNGTINTKGLHIPVIKEIYEPVLQELKNHGIQFNDVITKV